MTLDFNHRPSTADRINALFPNDGLLTPRRVQEIYDRTNEQYGTDEKPSQ